MALVEAYRRQVALLLKTIPFIAKETCFALKGGTAINLFVRELPRLSVDIDLTYLPVSPRAKSVGAIDKAMMRIAGRIRKGIDGAHVHESRHETAVTKLIVRQAGVQIKIEVTPVLRGCVYAPEIRSVTPAVEALFGFAEMRVVLFADLYAGKIVAALDRQHPRDLFDVRGLMANEGIGDDLRKAFAIYLLGHHRPMSEVLTVRPKDIAQEFEQNFRGMTTEPVELSALTAARTALVDAIVKQMPDQHRRLWHERATAAPEGSGAGRDLGEIGPTDREQQSSGLNGTAVGIDCPSVMLHLFQAIDRSRVSLVARCDRADLEMMVATYFVERFRRRLECWVIGQDR
jgi:predicted nucleotidyltransferase component of viral defense system